MPLGIRHMAMLTSNPRLIQYVLQQKHRNFQKSKLQAEELAHFIGHGLLTSNGAYRLKQRRLIQPGFHRRRLAGLLTIMLREIDTYLELFDKRVAKDKAFNMSDEMRHLTFNIVVKSLFSSDVEKSALEKLSKNFHLIQTFLSKQFRQPYLRNWFKISGERRKTEIIARHLQQNVLDIIQQRQQDQEKHDDLLHMLLETRYDNGEGMTDKQILDEALILIIAGHETSANALAWGWYLLCQHPEVVASTREEIAKIIGKGEPTYELLPKFEYLEQVIQEILRLYPPAWILERAPVEDDEFEGIHLPKNRIVGMDIYRLHRDPSYWTAPDTFNPSRFSKEEAKKRPAFTYLPFGGGPRLCIGNNFAMMEMKLILIRMLQRYDFEMANDRSVMPIPLITLRPKDGVWVKVKG